MTIRFPVPLGSLTRANLLRGVVVITITATVSMAAACSDEDTVDTVPPPRPTSTVTPDGPQGVPAPAGTQGVAPAPLPEAPFTRET